MGFFVSLCSSGWIAALTLTRVNLPVAIIMMVVASFFTICAALSLFLLKQVSWMWKENAPQASSSSFHLLKGTSDRHTAFIWMYLLILALIPFPSCIVQEICCILCLGWLWKKWIVWIPLNLWFESLFRPCLETRHFETREWSWPLPAVAWFCYPHCLCMDEWLRHSGRVLPLHSKVPISIAGISSWVGKNPVWNNMELVQTILRQRNKWLNLV